MDYAKIIDMKKPELPEVLLVNPVTQKTHRIQVLWQVVLPLVLGGLVILTLDVFTIQASEDTVDRGADLGMIIILLPVMIMLVILLALFSVTIYGLLRAQKVIPRFTYQAQTLVGRMQQIVNSTTDRTVAPILSINGWLAGIKTLVKRMRR